MTDQRIGLENPDEPSETRTRSGRARVLLAAAVFVVAGSLALFGLFKEPDPTLSAPPVSIVSTTEVPAATLGPKTSITLEYEADVELINQLWRDETSAWVDGFDSGLEFWVDNNYPEMGCNIDRYMNARFTDGRIEGLQVERIADPSSIELDEGWIIPGGRLEGVPAKGRVYVMSVTDHLWAPGYPEGSPTTRALHVTILDGRAHFFFGCPA